MEPKPQGAPEASEAEMLKQIQEKMQTEGTEAAQPQTLEAAKIKSDLQKALDEASPPVNQNKIWEGDTAKAILWKVTEDSVVDMTSNLTREEVESLKRNLYWYSITQNPRIAILHIAHLKLSKSLSSGTPTSVLQGLFDILRGSDVNTGGDSSRYARFKQLLGGT